MKTQPGKVLIVDYPSITVCAGICLFIGHPIEAAGRPATLPVLWICLHVSSYRIVMPAPVSVSTSCPLTDLLFIWLHSLHHQACTSCGHIPPLSVFSSSLCFAPLLYSCPSAPSCSSCSKLNLWIGNQQEYSGRRLVVVLSVILFATKSRHSHAAASHQVLGHMWPFFAKTVDYSCRQCYNVKASQNNTQSRTNIRLAVCCNIQNPCTVLLILHNICLKYRTALTEGPYQEPPWRSSTFTLQQYRLLV